MKLRGWISMMVLALCSATVYARTIAYTPALAVRTTGSAFLALSVTGEGFGSAGPGASVRILGLETGRPVRFQHPVHGPARVRVERRASRGEASDRPRTRTSHGRHAHRRELVRSDRRTMRTTRSTPRAAGGPNAAAAPTSPSTRAGRVWVNPEFKRDSLLLRSHRREAGALRRRIPVPMTRAPFRALRLRLRCRCHRLPERRRGHRRRRSRSRVWMPESGGALGSGRPPQPRAASSCMTRLNRRRCACTTCPATTTAPWASPGMLARGRIWLSQSNGGRPGQPWRTFSPSTRERVPVRELRLGRFDPATPRRHIVVRLHDGRHLRGRDIGRRVRRRAATPPASRLRECGGLRARRAVLRARAATTVPVLPRVSARRSFQPAHIDDTPRRPRMVHRLRRRHRFSDRASRSNRWSGSSCSRCLQRRSSRRVLPLAMIDFGLLAPWDIEIDRRG